MTITEFWLQGDRGKAQGYIQEGWRIFAWILSEACTIENCRLYVK
uniref:Uncharacterized protein n=1 Tax=Engystomops pustulosus TaxID=76066 RepID=A0AAV6Z6G5_ENGPU|nr:hypothetical protein GDO81_025827 [Engystomops pustulosus]